MWEIDKVSLRCPRCGWIPDSPIFLTLPLSNYACNEPDRHMRISCGGYNCEKSAKLVDWLKLSYLKI
ncbi:MAG: hypothetical protein ACPHF2_09935 [Crocinitomicaceae bacterium]